MFIQVSGSGHIPVSNISIGSELNRLQKTVIYSDNLKPFIQDKDTGECGICHQHRYGKTVQTVKGERFVCFKHRKLAYKL